MAMKRYLWILIAAPLLASCSASDAEEQAGGSATASVVSYDVTTDDITTRAAIANTEEFLTDGRQFRVWAFMKKDNTDTWTAMTSDYNDRPLQAVDVTYVKWRNEWLTYDANNPTTTVVYYWPRPEYAVNFYAVYPKTITFTPETKKLSYTVPVDGMDNDVMYATHAGQRDGTEKAGQRKAASMDFHHALTQVSFYAKLHSDLVSLGWQVEVNSITLCNVKSQGTLQLNASATNDDQFAELSSPVNYSLAMNADRLAVTTGEAGNVPLTSPTNIAMLLPQQLTAWNNASETSGTTTPTTDGCYLAVSLMVKDSENSPVFGSDPITVFSPFDCGVADGWKSGLRYKYTLTIKGGYNAKGSPVISPMGITAAIQPWNTDAAPDGTATHKPANN